MTAAEHIPILSVTGLEIEFAGGLRAVRGVDFSVRQGEVLGLVGESGCGKSVTCLSLLGLLPANGRVVEGSAMFDGQDLLSLDEKRLNRVRGRQIAYISQNSTQALNPILTIGRQIAETMMTHQGLDLSEARRRAVELLDRVGVPQPSKRLRAFPHQFSGGMNQRVMIAMALACDPAIVIADEPTTALDVTIQAQILELLAEIARERGTSVVMITHDLGIVAEMADRVAVMYAGRLVESGEVTDVFHNPRHPYTRGLLASRPRIDRRIETLTTIEGQVPSLREMPPGCPFSPRCEGAEPRCANMPGHTELDRGHRYACWNPEPAA
ncbi:ABC transporter ATP-binding protein [Frigidibacter sp. ROC022]|uniref:ABC transporter ATP-binding protein n=1 Tax=Frigidibacter sp. ROC022 TaxID=2971796 RepID=UPI00215B73CF|nr:ABC transporter ATP-binding protein [Frigidibacter sp. ROC022]MCR8723900.1 ABC transporter ATP-binding protein [Frigidibacter sp. ROC022]